MLRITAHAWFVPIIGSVAMISGGCSSSAPPPAIFLGHVATLSGQDATAGRSAELGIRLALADLGPAASESLHGRPFVVRHVDAAGSVDNAEAQAARLVSVNKVVGLIGGATKEEALALERARAPVLSPLGFRTSAMKDLLFTTGVSPATRGEFLADFLSETAPKAGVLIVDPRRDEASAFAETFRRAWQDVWHKKDAKAEPGRWREIDLPKDAKLAEWATEAVLDAPTSVVFCGSGADFEKVRRAWGAAVPVVVFAGDDGAWQGEPIAGQTVYVATAFALGRDGSKADEFAKKYREQNRHAPDVHAAVAYDNVRLLVEALKLGQAAAPEKLREQLLKIKDFPGLTGPLTFTPEQHLRRTVFVARVDGPGRVPAVVKAYGPQ